MSSNSSPGYTARTYIEFFFNQSGEVLGNGRESGSFRPADKDIIEESVILDFKKAYLAKAAADEKNNPVAFEAIADHFDRVNAAIRTVERKRLEAEPRQIDALLAFAGRAYRRPLTTAERDDLRAFYRTLRAQERPDTRRGDARPHRQRADVAALRLFGRGASSPRAATRPSRRERSLPGAHRSCARQQAELLPLVEHAGRRTARPRRRRRSAQRRPC